MVIGVECEIGQPSSNFGMTYRIHFRKHALKKDVYRYRLAPQV